MDEFSETREAETHWSQPLRGDTEIQYMGNCPKFIFLPTTSYPHMFFSFAKENKRKVKSQNRWVFAVHKNMVPENGAFTKSVQKTDGVFFVSPKLLFSDVSTSGAKLCRSTTKKNS